MDGAEGGEEVSGLPRVLGVAALALALTWAVPGAGWAQSAARLYLPVDRSNLVELGEPATKVSVANPNIADVQVITPNRLLVSGKGAGITSLVIFSAKSVQHLEVVVHPGPVGGRAVESSDAPYPVLVQRADKVSEHLFLLDKNRQWVELGTVKLETEAGKK
jgi:Flp pilus assembly secretin CpaC